MEITDESFEDSLARRLRIELDAPSVSVPAARPVPGAIRRYILPSALIVALATGLLIGSSAAAGSPNPVVWVRTPAPDSEALGLSKPTEPRDSSETSGSGSHASD